MKNVILTFTGCLQKIQVSIGVLSFIATVIVLALMGQVGFAVAGGASDTASGIWCGVFVSEKHEFSEMGQYSLCMFLFQFIAAGVLGIKSANNPTPCKVRFFMDLLSAYLRVIIFCAKFLKFL